MIAQHDSRSGITAHSNFIAKMMLRREGRYHLLLLPQEPTRIINTQTNNSSHFYARGYQVWTFSQLLLPLYYTFSPFYATSSVSPIEWSPSIGKEAPKTLNIREPLPECYLEWRCICTVTRSGGIRSALASCSHLRTTAPPRVPTAKIPTPDIK